MRRLLLAFLVLLAPALANAQVAIRMRQLSATNPPSMYLLNSVASNAAAGSRTATFSTGGYTKLSITFSIARSAATAITMTCKASTDAGAIYGNIPDQSVSSGTGTLVAHTWSYAISTNDAVTIDIGTGTYDSVQCLFGATGGGGSDLLTVSAIAGAP